MYQGSSSQRYEIGINGKPTMAPQALPPIYAPARKASPLGRRTAKAVPAAAPHNTFAEAVGAATKKFRE